MSHHGEVRHHYGADVAHSARVLGIGYVAIAVPLIALGFLITKVLDGTSLVAWDERTIRTFADNRTPSQNSLSKFWSKLADAPSIVAVALVACILLAIARRWRHISWLLIILGLELGTFLTISYIVKRVRPDVVHLGSVPSTGSFPSGHVAATVVLYLTLAAIARRRFDYQWVTTLGWVWTIVAALFVGWARMYRGMHHPLDVVAGAVMGLAIWRLGVLAFDRKIETHNSEVRVKHLMKHSVA